MIDWNMSEFWHVVCKKYNFNISAFIGFIVWNVESIKWYVCDKYDSYEQLFEWDCGDVSCTDFVLRDENEQLQLQWHLYY